METPEDIQPASQFLRVSRRRWMHACFSTLALSLTPSILGAESEAAVKAAYLYNFTTLIKWPSHAFPSSTSPLVLGLVGRNPTLSSLLDGRMAGSRPIEVRNVKAGDAASIRACNVIFLMDSEDAAQLASVASGLPILVVGETRNFAINGGTIGFVLKDNKVRLEINRSAARAAQLTIPSDLLAIASIVK